MQLAGELTKISLPSLIQLLRNGELTGKVCLTQGVNTAFIYVQGGRIIHVESDAYQGRAALLELFLWNAGAFSFVEAEVDSLTRSLLPDESVEKIVREGLAYADRKKQLDQLRITTRTVLKQTGTRGGAGNPMLERLDGRTSIGEIAQQLQMPRCEYITWVYELITKSLAVVVEPPAQSDTVNLPAWVVSRLRQDNPDISQAIVQMVIWVDRVKCWMYQADADLENVVGQLTTAGRVANDTAVGADPTAMPEQLDEGASSQQVEEGTSPPPERPVGIEF